MHTTCPSCSPALIRCQHCQVILPPLPCLQVHTDMLRSLRIARGVSDESKLAAGTISVEQSAASICSYVTSKLDMANSGRYWAADTDATLPW